MKGETTTSNKYGRRKSLRIDGLDVREKETASECESKVKSYINGKKMEEGGNFSNKL